MGHPISNFPLVLFPLKLETRFVANELWIRVFPDLAFLQGHDAVLNSEEREDARMFKQLTSLADKKENYETLVNKYGVYRAAYIVQINDTELAIQEEIALNQNGAEVEVSPSFYFKWLPDRLVYYLYREGDKQAAYKEEGSVIKESGLTVLVDDDEWVQDFDAAIKNGMGIKIKLDNNEKYFEKVIVSGIRYAQDPIVPAKGLLDLFRNHQYTEGMSFVDFGTPTNNTENTKSAFSIRDEFESAESFEYAVKGLKVEKNIKPEAITGVRTISAGKYLSNAMGLDVEDMKYIQNADLKPPKLSELFQKASWFALGAQSLFMLLANKLSSKNHEDIWEHYSKYVKPRGLYTSLQIGNQPYAILPVMNVRKALLDEKVKESENLFDQMSVLFAQLLDRWLLMTNEDNKRIPRLGDEEDSYTEILKILSMQEASSMHQIRVLGYNQFRQKLQYWLSDIAANANNEKDVLSKNSDYKKIEAKINSIQQLLQSYAIDTNQLVQVPVLAVDEIADQINLIQFKDGAATMTDQFGDLIANENGDGFVEIADPFSFVEEDLSEFQLFLDQLKVQDESDLVQYTADMSVFTDLFFRSYRNALQLYYREITFQPSVVDLKGTSHFNIGRMVKSLGDQVDRGDTILEINIVKNDAGVLPSIIEIKAPFDGVLEKINAIDDVVKGQNIKVGTPLFVLKNEKKYQKIKTTFIELGHKIVIESNAINEIPERKKAQTEAIRDALDLNSYRLDAWITSLATRRIEEMRKRSGFEKGIYFGAYGWLEHLSKDESHLIDNSLIDIYREEGGFVHCPGPAQTVASTIFRNAFLSYKEEQSNPFTLNLTSDRLQKSKFLLDGIRQGQQLEALLGYQLERFLHEDTDVKLQKSIYELRKAFPLDENIDTINGEAVGMVKLSVIDGLKAIKNKSELGKNKIKNIKKVKAYIEKLEDILDASLDALFYEAGYQITQGNISQAAAALDATKGVIEPPVLEALKTKVPGTGMSFKLALIFPGVNTNFKIENPRAFAAPVLENWLKENLGPLNKIACVVDIIRPADDSFIESVSINLAELKIGYLDLLYLSGELVDDGSSELELRIWKAVLDKTTFSGDEVKYKILNQTTSNAKTLGQALEVARYAYALLEKTRALRSEDLCMEAEVPMDDRSLLVKMLNDNFVPIIKRLKSFVQSDFEKEKVLNFLSKFDFETTSLAFMENANLDKDQMLLEIKGKLTSIEKIISQFKIEDSFDEAFDLLKQIARLLFGETFILIPPAVASDAFAKAYQSTREELLIGDPSFNKPDQVWGQERIMNWVEGRAQVDEHSETFEDWLMISRVWDQASKFLKNCSFKIVQGPTLLSYPWVALSKEEIDSLLLEQYDSRAIYKDLETGESYPLSDGNYYPDACESMVIHAPKSIRLKKAGQHVPVYGFVIDEFSEHIPDEKVDTGLGFHYNAPNSEPPQAILIAVHPKATLENDFFWSEDDLRDILFDTMDLYKIRMVDTDAMEEYGALLPMSYWFNIPET